MENQEKTTLELEQENNEKENENNSCNNNKSKKSLKWLWISLSIIALIAIIVWCAFSAVKINGTKITDKNGNVIGVVNGLEKWFSFKSSNNVFVIFTLSFIIPYVKRFVMKFILF